MDRPGPGAERRLPHAAADAGQSADFEAGFEASDAPSSVLEPPDWTILAANEARAWGANCEEQISR